MANVGRRAKPEAHLTEWMRSLEARTSLERIMSVIEACEIMKRDHGISYGLMRCAWCERGTISYSVAYNGHVHARCNNGCVAFMQ